jgi:hypothetical protein
MSLSSPISDSSVVPSLPVAGGAPRPLAASFSALMNQTLSESLSITLRSALRDFEVTGFSEANALRRSVDR